MGKENKSDYPSTSDLDQVRTQLIDYFPKLWAGLYLELVEHNVPEEVALEMVCTYIEKSTV